MRSGLFGWGGNTTSNPATGSSFAGPAIGSAERPLSAPARSWSGNDPIARLPRDAARKFQRLRNEQQDLGVLLADLASKQATASETRLRANDYLRRLRETRSSSGGPRVVSSVSTYMSRGVEPSREGVPLHRPNTADLQLQIDLAEAEVAEAEADCVALAERIAAVHAKRSRLPEEITRWLRELPANVVLTPYKAPARKTAPTPTVADVEAARQRINELRAEVSRVQAAPQPTEIAVAKMTAEIEALAAKGQPSVLHLVESGYGIKWPQIHIQSQVMTAQGAGIASQLLDHSLAFQCWLHKHEIIEALTTEIELLADDDALSDEQKAERTTQLEAQILRVEREEEALIEALEASGAPVGRRDNANPLAVLSLTPA